jgi:hypothetical protein
MTTITTKQGPPELLRLRGAGIETRQERRWEPSYRPPPTTRKVSPMKVRRGTLPTDNFTILSNQWLRDREISHRARGLLALIASHHEEYEFELDDLKTPI